MVYRIQHPQSEEMRFRTHFLFAGCRVAPQQLEESSPVMENEDILQDLKDNK